MSVIVNEDFYNFSHIKPAKNEKDWIKRFGDISVEEPGAYLEPELIKEGLYKKITECKDRGISDEIYAPHKITLSITTTEKRLDEVCYVIEGWMQQLLKVNRIILYLDKNLIHKELPKPLQMQRERGLEIHYVEDLGPYTKLLPALKEYPNDIIITCDDDTYVTNWVSSALIGAYIDYKQQSQGEKFVTGLVISNAGAENYGFKFIFKNPPLFAEGFGCILYPPHIFDEEVFNKDVYLKYAKYHDDLWFYIQEIRNNIYVLPAMRSAYGMVHRINNPEVQQFGLCKTKNKTRKDWFYPMKGLAKHYNLN